MQDFVYKKMSKKINNSIEFIEVSSKKSKKKKANQDELGCVRLLSDTDPITAIDFVPEVVDRPVDYKKPEIKRRIVEPEEYNDEEKLKLTSIDSDSILQQTETKYGNQKKSNQINCSNIVKKILYCMPLNQKMNFQHYVRRITGVRVK